MTKILLIGNGAREHVLAETFKRNKDVKLYSYLQAKNPGIIKLSKEFEIGDYSNLDKIINFSKKFNLDFAFIGPEGPLSMGVVDALQKVGIKSVGPNKNLARLESSKSFTRNLLKKYNIDGNPKFENFTKDNFENAEEFLKTIEKCVVKPDGLTGGKGIKVQDDHFSTKKQALKYCEEVLETHASVIIEEKFDGEEFSLQCLTDGKAVIATPPVQDHKRAYDDDKGPNTGGMGSYTCENHLLPFLAKDNVECALDITKKVAKAIYEETGEYYKGVMYGGFMVTKNGVKLIEYNARFGDPEVINVLPLLENNFSEVCKAIINQDLGSIELKFKNSATVCKYVVPKGYPQNPAKGQKVELENLPKGAKLYYASVNQRDDGLYMSSSRGIACLGISANLENAEKIAEESVNSIKGQVFHRKDIGTAKLIEKRVEHMKRLLG